MIPFSMNMFLTLAPLIRYPTLCPNLDGVAKQAIKVWSTAIAWQSSGSAIMLAV